MGEALQKENTYIYADYKDWELKEGERYELIHGEAFAMSAPDAYHQAISGELFRQLANYLAGKSCKAYSAPYDVRLFFQGDDYDNTVVQPDISVICDREKRGSEGCRGAPDMVVEVLSPSNTAEEMGRKFRLYREAGVKEYWVVSPKDKILDTHLFNGSLFHFNSYTASGKAEVGIFPGFTVDLEPVFAEDV
ncbi:MAG: Uma2 family endonuclease [Treponema sp.]|nr:Uma2 family endonuclease [Treponema sp.]